MDCTSGSARAPEFQPFAISSPVDTPRNLAVVRSVDTIIREVAARRGLTASDLKGPRRYPAFVDARHEAMWEARQPMANGRRRSLNMIGRHFVSHVDDRNHVDHTTVRHAVERHEKIRRAAALIEVAAANAASAAEHGA